MTDFVLTGYDPARFGCTASGCSTQSTETLCGRFGRRCRTHSPWATLAEQGKDGAAYWTLRAFTSGRAA